mmetsp:Transcript_58245/g.127893  ORF Transcript_58245/g.127893 Transcript_58245/m.127893 type:complete len:205 (+) Transcript_58245:85-699(+)
MQEAGREKLRHQAKVKQQKSQTRPQKTEKPTGAKEQAGTRTIIGGTTKETEEDDRREAGAIAEAAATAAVQGTIANAVERRAPEVDAEVTAAEIAETARREAEEKPEAEAEEEAEATGEGSRCIWASSANTAKRRPGVGRQSATATSPPPPPPPAFGSAEVSPSGPERSCNNFLSFSRLALLKLSFSASSLSRSTLMLFSLAFS